MPDYTDPNFMQRLRMQNIFGSPNIMIGSDLPYQGGITGTDFMNPTSSLFGNINFGAGSSDSSSPPIPPQSGLNDIATRMSDLYHPQHEAQDRLNDMLDMYPRDEKPSWGRALLGALSAMNVIPGPAKRGILGPANHDIGMSVVEEPERKKLQEWKNKIGPIEQAANLERQGNVNDRTLAYETVTNEIKQRAQTAKETNDERNTKIKQQRADIYEFKAKNPGLKLIFTKGGTVKAFNPITRETTDTGVETGTLSDTDKLNLGQDNALERIEARGKQERETEGVKEKGRETLAETRGWQTANIPDPDNPGQMIGVKINQITGEVQPIKFGTKNVGPITKNNSGNISKTESPTQTKVRQYNAARELVNSDPELGKFVTLGRSGNEFSVQSPGKNFFGNPTGPTPEQYNRIKQAIYGGSLPINQPTRTGNITNTTKSNIPNVPAGRVAIQDKTGKRFSVPKEQVQEAIRQGYSLIQ